MFGLITLNDLCTHIVGGSNLNIEPGVFAALLVYLFQFPPVCYPTRFCRVWAIVFLFRVNLL